MKTVRWVIMLQENKEARTLETGFFLRERRYANLGHLLPMFYIERAVKPGVSALPHSWPAISTITSNRKMASGFHGGDREWRGLPSSRYNMLSQLFHKSGGES